MYEINLSKLVLYIVLITRFQSLYIDNFKFLIYDRA